LTGGHVAVVTGAGGQDGYFLTRHLLAEGWRVCAVVRASEDDRQRYAGLAELDPERFEIRPLDITDADSVRSLLRELRPQEIYNLAGQSSVSTSFRQPLETWQSNADAVLALLEAVRDEAADARVYQSSSGEMFGWMAGQPVVHDELSPFLPQSPYAVAKAAAHLLCGAYRRAYGFRVACGILFNHESHRRPAGFLTRKVVDHVLRLRRLPASERAHEPPLRMGNLAARRDWGFAPDYVDGIVSITRQIEVRRARGELGIEDTADAYRDYILATGQLHAVWELVDRAFSLGGIPLVWELESADATAWHARFANGGAVAVEVDPGFLRPSDPPAITADPSRAREELGWDPRIGLDAFLADMLTHG
jgi:GDPmannose 4,6-dehydratase